MAPLLFVRVAGPEGLTVTFLEGPSRGRTLDLPATVGLRPGWFYRLQINGLPEGAVLYPSLHVIGTLKLPPRQKAADHPAPVVFTAADIRDALNGALVTKVVLLEDPEKALPTPLIEGEPAEVEVAPGDDPVAYAKTLGRPVMIVRIGRREPEPRELAQMRPGMVLYPGEKALPPQPGGHLLVPPAHGHEECLRDGGDRGTPAHFEPGGRLQGLDPADNVAEYTDSQGRRRLAITNTVCLCVPRFVVVRHLLPPAGYDRVLHLAGVQGEREPEQLASRQPPRRVRQVEEAELIRRRTPPAANVVVQVPIRITGVQVLQATELVLGPAELIGTAAVVTLTAEQKARLARQVQLAVELSRSVGPRELVAGQPGPRAVGQVVGLGQVVGWLETREVVYICPEEQPALPEQPLQVLKWASTHQAQIGDVVTFYIKYSNLGGRPIHNIAVSDSLTARLEYVPGSARSDREAVFVTQENEAGSLILRWEIQNPLPPGERGVVSFQARVR
jgi:uncharacterized repeat protein (TIGR01451 family)